MALVGKAFRGSLSFGIKRAASTLMAFIMEARANKETIEL